MPSVPNLLPSLLLPPLTLLPSHLDHSLTFLPSLTLFFSLLLLQQLRLSLLSYSSQSSPLHSPITHTQYFLAPTEFWSSVRQPRPPTSGSNASPPSSPPPSAAGSSTGEEQGLLEGLVGGLEVRMLAFLLFASHPSRLSPSPSPPSPFVLDLPVFGRSRSGEITTL